MIEEAGPLHNARKLIQAKHRAKKLNQSSIPLSLKPSGSTGESPGKSAAKHDRIPVRYVSESHHVSWKESSFYCAFHEHCILMGG